MFFFMNNDDWVYYKMVESFLHGNYSLDPLSAPTFYSQGFIAFLFAKLFGIQNLPILTIIISLFAVVIFILILFKYFNLSKLQSLVTSLFILFNPLFVYSSAGFMTENYFLFYLFISLFLFYKFEKSKSKSDFLLLAVSIFISLMLRQVAFVFILSMILYYILKKEYKSALYSFLMFVIFYSFYQFVFPQTPEMHEKSLKFDHLLRFDYIYALIYGSLIIISSVTLPFISSFILPNIKKLNFKTLAFFLVIGFSLFLVLNRFYKPMSVSWGEFPYFENNWERSGFYPRGIDGTKYLFRYNFDLYNYWDLFSKISVAGIISFIFIVLKKSKLLDFNLIFVILYLGLMLVTETFYDRYLLVVIPFVLLFLVKNLKYNKNLLVLNCVFLMFLGFYSYLFVSDFVLVNNYIWGKSQMLVNAGANSSKISANHGWNFYSNVSEQPDYLFSYDSSSLIKDKEYKLIETKNINFPLNIFINPKIYLYSKVPN